MGQTLLRAAQHPKTPQEHRQWSLGPAWGLHFPNCEPREFLNHSQWKSGPVVEDFLLSLCNKYQLSIPAPGGCLKGRWGEALGLPSPAPAPSSPC